MALTITENFRYTAGGRQFRYISVTDDESTSTISAASLDLTYIEYAANVGFKYSSDVANLSVAMQHLVATALGTTMDIGTPANAASIKKFIVIGW